VRRRAFIARLAGVVVWLLIAGASGVSVQAEEWPGRLITMVVPYAAGGPVDTVGRIMAAGLSEKLRQQVVVENASGAGGMTGSSRVAKATPDGYTLLLGGLAVLGLVPNLYKKPLYNPVTDFTPVSLFADSARILIVRKDFPADNFKDFVAYAQANQAKMQFGSSGAGSGLHICAVLLNIAMGTTITHVPYRGSPPALQDLLGGRIDFMCEQISTAFPQIQSGAVKAIVTLGPERTSVLPDLPTAQEQGLPDLDCSTWSAFVFPKGTPEAIVRRLAETTSEVVDTPLVRDRFASVGVTVAAPERRGPQYLTTFIPRELNKWAGPIATSGATAD
jgi:tripartite-type tricarboxylate transporter receptor subunit TctC